MYYMRKYQIYGFNGHMYIIINTMCRVQEEKENK